jgi:hypothetical protein
VTWLQGVTESPKGDYTNASRLMHTPDNAPAINATELASKRAELQAELNRIESLLNQCFKVSAPECAALIGCRISDVPARLETLRKDAAFFRQVLTPVSLPKASEITPEAPALPPGPWIADDRAGPEEMLGELSRSLGTGREWVAVGIVDEDGVAAHVAYCHPLNAPLISAAPDLLAALKSLVNVISSDGQLLHRYYKLSDGSLGDAQNAIAKAEGSK